MHIKIIEILFVIIMGLMMGTKDSKIMRRSYIILCSILFLVVAAFRSPEWMTAAYGIDTAVYRNYFNQAIDMSWDEIGSALRERYVIRTGDFDIGYYVICKLIGLFTSDFGIFSLLADLLFFVPFGMMIYRYSTNMKQVMFAYVFYLALIQTYLIGGARQIFAIGLDIMAFLAILNKRRIMAIVFFLLGVTVHFSSLLFFIPFLMIWFNVKETPLKIFHVVMLLLVPVALLMPNEIILLMGDISGLEKYSNYGAHAVQGGADTYVILIELLSIFCLIAIKKKNLKDNENMRKFYVMVPLLTFFAPLIKSNGSMDRITLNYYLYLVVLIPYAIECVFNQQNKKTVYAIVIGALAFLIVANDNFIYYFYWQR